MTGDYTSLAEAAGEVEPQSPGWTGSEIDEQFGGDTELMQAVFDKERHDAVERLQRENSELREQLNEAQRRQRVLMGKWRIRRQPSFDGDPYPWTLICEAWESLDWDSDLAAIESGQWATFEEALAAFNKSVIPLLRNGEF